MRLPVALAVLWCSAAWAGITPSPTVPIGDKYPRGYLEFPILEDGGTPVPDADSNGIEIAGFVTCYSVEREIEGRNKLRWRCDRNPTATPTLGANDCCQHPLPACGQAVSHSCGPGTTPVYGAVCSTGARCATFTPTPTP